MADQEQARIQDLGIEEQMQHYQEALDACRNPVSFREVVMQNVYRSLIEECRARARSTMVETSDGNFSRTIGSMPHRARNTGMISRKTLADALYKCFLMRST